MVISTEAPMQAAAKVALSKLPVLGSGCVWVMDIKYLDQEVK
jgi:hypothetical protein